MSFISNYSDIVNYVQDKISVINTLSATDAALVAAMAQLLNGRNQPISNMNDLLAYLQDKQDDVTSSSLVKDVTLLLGASLPSKSTVWVTQEYLSNGTFTVPDNIAGNTVLVTGSGGGASGQAMVAQAVNIALTESGNSGCFVEDYPYQVTAGQVINIVIGQGGAAVTATAPVGADNFAPANAGGDTVFGLLTIPGGSAQVRGGGGWRSGYDESSTVSVPAQNSIRYRAGLRVQNGNAISHGTAAGAFGNGVNGTVAVGVTATGISPSANSGAAGGSVSVTNNTGGSLSCTSAAGSDGRLLLKYKVFV